MQTANSFFIFWVNYMKLKIAEVQQFKNILSAVATIIDEATFQLDTYGLKLTVMDPSRVAMIDLVWAKSNFEEFECNEPTKLCFNIGQLLKLIKGAGKGDKIELVEESGKLRVTIAGKYSRSFTMPLLEPALEEVPVPKIAFNVKAKVTVESLSRVIDDARLVSDHIKIEAMLDKLVFKAAGDLMEATMTFEKGSDALLEPYETKETGQRAVFGLTYLQDIVKSASALSDLATVEFSKDMPVKLDFQQPNPDNKLIFYMAPRIEPE